MCYDIICIEDNMKKKIKVLGGVICAAAVLAAIPSVLYLKVLPAAVSNPRVISFVEKNVNKYTDLNVEIKNPVLKTSFSPVIAFKTDKIKLAKNDIEIFAVENLDTEISFKDLFKKRIILNRFGLDYIFADVNKLMALAPRQEEQKQQKNDWEIDFFDSVLYLKKSLILYKLEPDVFVKLNADNLKIDNTQKVEKFVHFDIDTKIKKGDKILHFAIADKNRVVIKDKTLFVKDCVLDINKSNVHINADASRKNGLNVNLSSKKFKVKDVIDIVDSNIIINNGSEMLAFFKDMDGDFDFNINMKNNDLNGTVNLNKSSLKIIPVSNLPITVNKGTVVLTSNDITLKDIEGYYGSQQINKIAVNGIMKDYTKSCDTEVTITTVATNDFAKNLKVGDIIILSGELGSGKTKFTQGVLKYFGLENEISSPTFTIVNEYHSGRIPFYHFDVYRIGDEDEMFDIGFDEYVDGDGVCLIEWAELIKGIIPENAVSIKITKDLSKGLDYRKIEVEE